MSVIRGSFFALASVALPSAGEHWGGGADVPCGRSGESVLAEGGC